MWKCIVHYVFVASYIITFYGSIVSSFVLFRTFGKCVDIFCVLCDVGKRICKRSNTNMNVHNNKKKLVTMMISAYVLQIFYTRRDLWQLMNEFFFRLLFDFEFVAIRIFNSMKIFKYCVDF